MFTVGHIALGYIFAKTSAKILQVPIHLPTVFFLAIISDIDLLIPFLRHRGVTHSLILTALLFIPLFTLYGRQTIPYFVSLVQHGLVGDLLTTGAVGGVQLLWPITNTAYSLKVPIAGTVDVAAEWLSFLIAIAIILQTKDFIDLFKGKKENLLLLFPAGAIFFSTILPISIRSPAALLIPEITFFVIFLAAILRALTSLFQRLLS